MKLKEFCQLLDVTPATVRRWQKLGHLQDNRLANNMRTFTIEDVEKMQKLRGSRKLMFNEKSLKNLVNIKKIEFESIY